MSSRRYFLSLVLIASITIFTNAPDLRAQTAATAVDLDYQITGVLYSQKAAEYRALAYQAFNIARLRLDEEDEEEEEKEREGDEETGDPSTKGAAVI